MNPSKDIKSGRPSEAPEWLTTPIEFEEQRSFRVSRRTMHLLVAFCAAAVLWAAIAPIRELSLARGQLVPVSQIRPVQHLEGGMVEEILVGPGADRGEGSAPDAPAGGDIGLRPLGAARPRATTSRS